MTIRQHIKKAVLETARLNYRHFHWMVQWKPTGDCNLNCVYCPELREPRHPNLDEVSETIIQLDPKYLIVTGGEPTLHPHLEKYLRRIRSRTNALIRLMTNGTRPDPILKCLPYVDVVLISVDGTGEVNRANKGMDGRIILDTIEKVAEQAKKYGVSVATNTVVTKKSLDHLEETTKAVSRISRDILLLINPVLPCALPLSVGSDSRLYEEFLGLVKALKKRYNVFTVPHDQSWARERVICRRQYFRTEVTPDGQIYTCFPDRYLAYYTHRVRHGLAEGGKGKLWSDVLYASKHLWLKKYRPLCPFPCNCEEELEDIFYAAGPGGQPGDRRLLDLYSRRLPFTDRDIEAGARFIREIFDPDYSEDHLIPYQAKQ